MNIGVDISALTLKPPDCLTFTAKLEIVRDDGTADYVSGIRELIAAVGRNDASARASLAERYRLGGIKPSTATRELIERISGYTGDGDNLFGFTSAFRGSIDDRLFFSGESAFDFISFLSSYPYVDVMKQNPMLLFSADAALSFDVSSATDSFTVAPVISAGGNTYRDDILWYGRQVFAGRTVYTPSFDVRTIAELFGITAKHPLAAPLTVDRESYPSFMRTVYPKLTRFAPLALPPSFSGAVAIAEPCIYLDADTSVRGILSFRYGSDALAIPESSRFTLPGLTYSSISTSVRDAKAEESIIDRFRTLFGPITLFGAEGMEEKHEAFGISFELTDDRTAMKFIREIYPALAAGGYTVAVTPGFDRFAAIRRVALSASFDEADGWFTIRFDIAGISPDDIKAVMKAIRAGHSSIRLSDGSLVDISSPANRKAVSLADGLSCGDDLCARVSGVTAAAAASVLSSIGIDTPGRAAEIIRSLAVAPAPVKLEEPLDGILRPYQRDGVAFLVQRMKLGMSCILADDMGLGKTLMALAFLTQAGVSKKKPALIICPSTLTANWENEAKRFIGGRSTVVLAGSPEERSASFAQKADIYITSYACAVNDGELHRGREYALIIIDEAQQIKNHESQRARMVREFNAPVRLALTGTPVENRLTELWSIADFCMPGVFGERAAFDKRYASVEGDDPKLDLLRAQLKAFVLRRTKAAVAPDLPPRIESILACDLSDEQKKMYLAIREQAVRDVKKLIDEGRSRNYLSIFAALTKLKQVVCHPFLAGGVADMPSAKTELFLEMADEIVDNGRRAIVFSQYTSMLDILGERLQERGYRYLRLDGSTKKRGDVVDQFQDEKGPPFFLISLRAGGTGLTLTAADTVILYDLWWNPAVERQAADRAHRIGQTRTVNIYRLVARGTIEERILALQAKKADLADSLIDEASFSQGALSEDDIRMLLDI